MFPRFSAVVAGFILTVVGLEVRAEPPREARSEEASETKQESKGSRLIAEARERWLHGNYAEAEERYTAAAAAEPKLAPRAAIGISRCQQSVGNYEAALKAMSAALTASPKDADLLAARGDLLYRLGRWDEAMSDADNAIALREDQLLARWTRARLLRDRGDLEKADQAIRWIVRYYTARNNADNAITDPEELLIVAEAGIENARWHNLSRQFRFILNEVLGDALKAEANFWPAEQLAGEMLLEKYNRPDALDAFDKVLKINPKATEAFVGKGEAALQRYEIKDAEQYATQALQCNPNHPAALRLLAEVELMTGRWAEAERHLNRARRVNPRDEVTLGRLAAVAHLKNQLRLFEELVREVTSFSGKPGIFYYELARCLDDQKRYREAERYYRQASEFRPMLAGPRTGLGMLYLRLGDETQGRDFLAKAFEADPFNVRVSNSLKVLRHLEQYETITTPHYRLRFHPQTDALLATFLAEYLEEVHAELKRQFNYEPPEKILIELFSTHEMFSGRTVGLPDLHTIGACTGYVVAMASPAAKGVRKPFNWGRVIRHELTHVFNLVQTDFLCPHWLTEGLAVRNEQMSRPRDWWVILRERLEQNDLFNLDTIMLGFVRPKSPDEWALAYCQSQLYVEYLIQTYGEDAIRRLLTSYGQGRNHAEALHEACGVKLSEFENGYRRFLEEVIKPYRRPGKPQRSATLTLVELETAQQKEPDNPELTAKLADHRYRRNRFAEAETLCDAVLANHPGHPLATIVKARLLLRARKPAEAQVLLETAIQAHPDDPQLLLALARSFIESGRYAAAAKILEHGRKVAPLDGDWLEQLARIYAVMDDEKAAISVLEEITAADPDELDGRLRLAKAYLAEDRVADAERVARDALRIDVNNERAQTILLQALTKQGQEEEVKKLTRRFSGK